MSYRSDNGASYDRTLLSSVPDPTRAEKQEGYNVDLLDNGSAPAPPKEVPSEGHGPAPAVGYSPGAASYAREVGTTKEYESAATPTKVPWYRKRWGIAFIVIVVVCVIAGVVGGVVGGTHQSSHPQNNSAAASAAQAQPSSTNKQPEVTSPSTAVSSAAVSTAAQTTPTQPFAPASSTASTLDAGGASPKASG